LIARSFSLPLTSILAAKLKLLNSNEEVKIVDLISDENFILVSPFGIIK